ncbi:MAG: hypothetical protein GQF41_3505 [Candidatus Rifleibacterium amylolyticum]|nr:MAG: hypothetical protein GQF41_3505 [Candidatus Rifleibacterium amylolyticum]
MGLTFLFVILREAKRSRRIQKSAKKWILRLRLTARAE